MNVLLCLIIMLYSWFMPVPSAIAKQVKSEVAPGTIVCFSGGKEILRKQMVSGPFADEYKFAHEVQVTDDAGEYSLNFAGGLCIIERGATPPPSKLAISDYASARRGASPLGYPSNRLTCYSGADEIVTFDVYGRESTVDEYVEGRTFWAKSKGKAFNTDALQEYLVFGGGACIGQETQD